MNAPVTLHANPAMYISPEMIAELALGMDPPLDIAARNGFDAQQFAHIQATSWFPEMVIRKRLELEENGQTFGAKCAQMMEELYMRLFQSALVGGLTPSTMLEFTKQLGEMGGIKAKQNAPVQQLDQKFQININVDMSKAQGPGPRIIDAVAVAKPVTITIPKDDLPPMPSGFRVQDFKLTNDLVGTPAAIMAAQAQPVPSPGMTR